MPIRRDSHGRFAGGGGSSGRRGARSKRSTTKDVRGRKKVAALKASTKARTAVFGNNIYHLGVKPTRGSSGNRRRFGQGNLRTANYARSLKGGAGASVRAGKRKGSVRVHYKKR